MGADGGAVDKADEAKSSVAPGDTTDMASADALSQYAGCIVLGDIPSVNFVSADPSQEISRIVLLEGPCSVQDSRLEFYYWDRGYSCPSLGDSVTCSAEVFSREGSSVKVQVSFEALPLTMSMLYWRPSQQSWVKVSFPSVDGGGGN